MLVNVELGIFRDSRGVAKPWLATFGKRGKVYCASIEEAREVRRQYIEERDAGKPKPVGYVCINKVVQSALRGVLKKARKRTRMRNLDDEKRAERNRRNAEWAARNKTRMRAMIDDWIRHNRQHRRERENARNAERRQTDDTFVVKRRCRARLGGYLKGKGASKADSTFTQVCLTPKELTEHVVSQLHEDEDLIDMRLDHIFPMASYNVCDDHEQRQMMHYSNMQPLTSFENGSKGDRYPTKAMAAKVERWAWPPDVTEDMLPEIYEGWSTPLRM